MLNTLSTRENAWLADIQRTLNSLSEHDVKYKSFHNRLKSPEWTQTLKQLVEQAATTWLLAPFKRSLPDNCPFDTIEAHERSSLALHVGLAAQFPGRFTRSTPVAIELHMTMNVVSVGQTYMSIAPDTECECHHMPFHDEIRHRLQLMDVGFFDIQWCCVIHRHRFNILWLYEQRN